MADLNDQLRQRRQALKLTQQAVAQQLHVSRQTISNWERGSSTPNWHDLQALSQVYSLPLAELIQQTLPTNQWKQIWLKRTDYALVILLLGLFVPIIFFDAGQLIVEIIVAVDTILLMLVSGLRYYLLPAFPSKLLFIPKRFGWGWAINPRNPLGLVLNILVFIGVIVMLLVAIFST